MSRTLKNENLYIQEDHNMFINCNAPFLLVLLSNFWGALHPTPLIPLPSVSFQCKTFRPMLVRGRTTLSHQIDAEKRTGFGAGRGQGEGRLKFLTLKNLGVID